MPYKDPAKEKARKAIQYKKYREQILEKGRKKYHSNIAYNKERARRYYLAHKKEKQEYQKNRRKARNKTDRERYQRIKNDLNYKIAKNLRTRVLAAIKGKFKSKSVLETLGCSIEELKIHLEKQFTKGMSWENWGIHGWHIDHIQPLKSFDLTNQEQFLIACNYKNLQPLWAEDNLRKGHSTS